MSTPIPPRLAEAIQDFQLCDRREKLELLIQFADSLPNLPERFRAQLAQTQPVPECMTIVHVFAEAPDGKMRFYFDIPPESPTVRGFAAILLQGLDGLTPQDILQVPADFYQQMGLNQVLTYQRLHGITAILAHMKRLAAQYIGVKMRT